MNLRLKVLINLKLGLDFEELGGGHPVEGWGKNAQGEDVFFRFREDSAQLYIGDTDEPRLYAEINGVYGDELRGELEDAQILPLLERLVALLKSTAEWETGTRRDRVRSVIQDHLNELDRNEGDSKFLKELGEKD